MNNPKRLNHGMKALRSWWHAKPVIFADRFDPRNNAIGFMRTAFALLVIMAHSYPLGGFGLDPLFRFGQGQETLGGVAVKGFFVLSGFLITASFVRSTSAGRYFWHRFLRIMPGFWAALVVVAFGFAPVMQYLQHKTLHGIGLLQPEGPLHYIKNNFLLSMHQYNISRLTNDIPWKYAFNGSLWTLVYEVMGYIGVGAIGVFGILKDQSKLVFSLTAVLYGVYILNQAVPGAAAKIAPFLGDPQLVPLMLFFFAGSAFYLYREKIILSNKMAVLAAVIYLLGLRYHFHILVSPIVYTYLVFYLAAEFPIKGFDRKADFSYGIYIYAFPVQQLLAQLGVPQYGIAVYALTAALITFPLAVASYYIVEKPALRMKNARLRLRRT